jgi:hypothetical protein
LQTIQATPHVYPTSFSGVGIPAYKAVLIDAAGTLLVPTERTADVYLRYGTKYGVKLSENEVLNRFRRCVLCESL